MTTMTLHAPCADHEVAHAAPIPYELNERAEARLMLDELNRILTRTRRLNLKQLERAMSAQGTPVSYRTLLRWFGGTSTPLTTTPVEHLARAAGISRVYLIGGRR